VSRTRFRLHGPHTGLASATSGPPHDPADLQCAFRECIVWDPIPDLR